MHTVFQFIERAERSRSAVAATCEAGQVKSIPGDPLTFDSPRGELSQPDFLRLYRGHAFDIGDASAAEESEPEEDSEWPAKEDAIAWAEDPDTADEDIRAYLVDVAGEDNRERKRETAIEKVRTFVNG